MNPSFQEAFHLGSVVMGNTVFPCVKREAVKVGMAVLLEAGTHHPLGPDGASI